MWNILKNSWNWFNLSFRNAMAEPSEIMRLSFLPAMPGDFNTRVDSMAMLPGMPLDLPDLKETPQDQNTVTDVSVLDDILVGFSDLSADLENTLNDTK